MAVVFHYLIAASICARIIYINQILHSAICIPLPMLQHSGLLPLRHWALCISRAGKHAQLFYIIFYMLYTCGHCTLYILDNCNIYIVLYATYPRSLHSICNILHSMPIIVALFMCAIHLPKKTKSEFHSIHLMIQENCATKFNFFMIHIQ